MMNLQQFSSSENFFNCKEPLAEAGVAEFNSWRGRGKAMLRFYQQMGIIPLAFLAKFFRTCMSALGLGFASSLLVLTLCCESGIRGFFLKKFTCFAKDLADWILWPAAITVCLGRLLLAATIHPALYFSV
jgi:hypothetical protein